MRTPKPAVVDCETLKIEGRPSYPPVPVGVAIKMPGEAPRYYAFGHRAANNCTWEEARDAIERAYACEDGVAFYNGKFDLDVIEVHMGVRIPHWQRVHDVMFLAFLDEPHRRDLRLKPLSVDLLGMPSEERGSVEDWLVEHQPIPGVKISKAVAAKHPAGAYIAYAPAELVGKYAIGDVVRTERLFRKLWPLCRDRKMLGAYDRERELMPILLEMERQGVAVNLPRLRKDVVVYRKVQEQIEAWVRKRLRAPELNLDSDDELYAALERMGKVDSSKLLMTDKGNLSMAKDSLQLGLLDKLLLSMLQYRGQLSTCLRTFMEPWLAVAEKSNGLIFTTWNQIRGEKGGARTGRLSSTPNFQNIPNEFKPLFAHEASGLKLPRAPFDIPPLPHVRSYIVPFPGDVFIDRDYSQQEPRILAHFDGGQLMLQFIQEPWTDFHDYAKAALEAMGRPYPRKTVKTINLGLIYGMGVGLLAERTGLSVDETKVLKKMILNLYKGLDTMYKDMKVRAKLDEPIRTWGGREYYCEPSIIHKGRVLEFDYKMVNVLIQGSAADCTKEALIRYHRTKSRQARIVLNVHDQLTASVPKQQMHSQMEVMRMAMESVEFDVPMLSEGAVSHTNWDELKDYDVKGNRV